ncbi:MAG: hypothetical protein ACE5J2_04470 [Nitrososphaerales archaeon]
MPNPYTKMIVWMVATAAVSIVLTYYFGFIIGLALAFGVFILLNIMVRRRALRSGFGGTFRLGVTYRCIQCGHRFKGGACPRCGSKMRSAEF